MGLPVININFKKLAESANQRAERGILCVIVTDTTGDWTTKEYASVAEIDADDYTAENYAAICRAFTDGLFKLIVTKAATTTAIQSAVEAVSANWVCAVPTTYQSGLSTAVKAINAAGTKARKIKALVAGVSGANDMHVVNVSNTTVTLKGASATTAINLYLPRIAGMLAACPLTESITYKEFTDLDAVSAVSNIGTTVDGGNIVIFQDDDAIRVARGVNTLTTLGTNQTEDMKKIAVVEGMDIIQEDIVKTFKASYLGRVKNSADNQTLFVAEVLEYFQQLASEGIIDNVDGTYSCDIDLAAMRVAWEGAGESVADLSDAQLRKKTFRSSVFVKATCRILDAMEDLQMVVALG